MSEIDEAMSMPKQSPDLMLLLRMVRYRGWLAETDIESALAGCGAQPTAERLLELLCRGQRLTPDQADDARRFLKEKSRSLRLDSGERFRIDRSFGQLAMERGWLDVAQLEAALLEQERLRRLRLNFRIGEVLVRLGSLEVEQVRTILREQGFDLACCSDCDALVEGARQGDGGGICPHCGGELRPPVFLDPVPADRVRSR
jgi:hypothetical protein